MYRKLKIDKQKIISEYLQGLSAREVAKLNNCSSATVLLTLKNLNVPARKKKGIIHCVHTNRKIDLSLIKTKEGSPEFDYFLGILATDGCITGTAVKLQFSEDNKQILENFKTFLMDIPNITSFTRKSDQRTYYTIAFKNADICDYYSSFGITPRKTCSVKLKYINWDVLLGIFDGDGCLVFDGRKQGSWKFSICSASIDFVDQLAEFYRNNGIIPYVYKEKNYYTINVFNINDIYKIYTNIYKNSSYFLQRKYDKFCPLVKKFTSKHSVNSVKGMEYHKTEPSPNREGAETLNGEPK